MHCSPRRNSRSRCTDSNDRSKCRSQSSNVLSQPKHTFILIFRLDSWVCWCSKEFKALFTHDNITTVFYDYFALALRRRGKNSQSRCVPDSGKKPNSLLRRETSNVKLNRYTRDTVSSLSNSVSREAKLWQSYRKGVCVLSPSCILKIYQNWARQEQKLETQTEDLWFSKRNNWHPFLDGDFLKGEFTSILINSQKARMACNVKVAPKGRSVSGTQVPSSVRF